MANPSNAQPAEALSTAKRANKSSRIPRSAVSTRPVPKFQPSFFKRWSRDPFISRSFELTRFFILSISGPLSQQARRIAFASSDFYHQHYYHCRYHHQHLLIYHSVLSASGTSNLFKALAAYSSLANRSRLQHGIQIANELCVARYTYRRNIGYINCH